VPGWRIASFCWHPLEEDDFEQANVDNGWLCDLKICQIKVLSDYFPTFYVKEI
jgi:hypothetical protein